MSRSNRSAARAGVPQTSRVIVLQPVLEIHASDGFTLWPVAESAPYGFLPLSGAHDPAEVGTAMMRIADCNNIDPEEDGRPPRPAGPLEGFLHGLLTMDDLFASGGLRITDTATGTTLLPGCCNGLDEGREWSDASGAALRARWGQFDLYGTALVGGCPASSPWRPSGEVGSLVARRMLRRWAAVVAPQIPSSSPCSTAQSRQSMSTAQRRHTARASEASVPGAARSERGKKISGSSPTHAA